jgi:hypothetical protein
MDDAASMLSPKIIGLCVGLHFTNVMWLTSDLIHYYHHQPDDVPRTVAKPAHLAVAAFAFLCVGAWSVIKLFYPPGATSPFAVLEQDAVAGGRGDSGWMNSLYSPAELRVPIS